MKDNCTKICEEKFKIKKLQNEFKIEDFEEELRIRKLQDKFKMGYIDEEDISEVDREKLIKLYKIQNEKLKDRLKLEKKEISELLNK